jgi:hypothetical protein
VDLYTRWVASNPQHKWYADSYRSDSQTFDTIVYRSTAGFIRDSGFSLAGPQFLTANVELAEKTNAKGRIAATLAHRTTRMRERFGK